VNQLEEVLNLMGNGFQENSGIADLYLNFVKPMFEYLAKSLLPNENFAINLPPKQVFVLMQISTIMILKHLNNIEKTCCDQALEFRKELQKFYNQLDIVELNKCMVGISNDLKLNSTIKITNPQIPSQMLDIYTTYFKKMLESKTFLNSLDYLNSIDQNIKKITNSVSFSSMRLDLKVPNFDIPMEIQDDIPFVDLGVQFDGTDFIKYLIDNNPTQCRKASSSKLSPLDRNCFDGIDRIVKKMTDSIKNVMTGDDEIALEENINKKIELEIQPMIVEMLDDLKNINIIAQEYVSDTYSKMDQLVNQSLKNINPEMVDIEKYAFDSIEQMAKLTQFIGRIDKYCVMLDEKIKEHYELRHELYRAHLVEKSILKYAPEAIIKSEQFILSYFKFDWLKYFFNYVTNDMFGWLKKFNIMFDKNYMIVMGSINTRVVSQFLLSIDDDEGFFNNKDVKNQVEQEFYDSLEPSLGQFMRLIIHKLIKIGSTIDKNQTINILELNSNDKMLLSKNRLDANHSLCFSNIGLSNRSLNVLLFSTDFIYLSALIKCSLSQNFEATNEILEYLNNEMNDNLTNIVYVRWLLWACVFYGTITGNDWIGCCIKLDKKKHPALVSALVKHLGHSKLNNISIINETITVDLVKANQSVKINSNKFKTHQFDKYPKLEEFLTFEQSDNVSQHKVQFETSTNDIYKDLKNKFVLLNMFGGVLGSSEMYYFDKIRKEFRLVVVEKKTLQIHIFD